MKNVKETKENNKKESKKEPEILTFTKHFYNEGVIDKEQVDAMEQFVKGEVDYGTMRSICG